MTDLALPDPPASSDLLAWADSFTQLARVAGQIARTAFVPASLRVFRDNGRTYDAEGTAAQITAAILTGAELDMRPMAALRSINIIQSTPALSALALRAVLLARGHEIKVEDATNTRVTVAGRRAGSEDWQRITWTMDDAKSRNLHMKPNWRTQPRNMLIARATADVARLVAADALLGVPYTEEELSDGDTESAAQPAAIPAAPSRTAQRRTRQAPAPAPTPVPAPGEPAVVEDEPPLDGDSETRRGDVAQPVVEPTPAALNTEMLRVSKPVEDAPLPDDASVGLITKPQSAKLHAGLRDLGITLRADALAQISQWIGHDIASTSELTQGEASTCIDQLNSILSRDREVSADVVDWITGSDQPTLGGGDE